MYNKLYMHTEFTEDTEVLDSWLKNSLCSPCSLCEIIKPESNRFRQVLLFLKSHPVGLLMGSLGLR
jgi:hypothetical protein